jgi:hypothetical protein
VLYRNIIITKRKRARKLKYAPLTMTMDFNPISDIITIRHRTYIDNNMYI